MKQIFKLSLISGLAIACVLAFQNCSKVNFSTDEAASLVKDSSTTDSATSNNGGNGNDTSCSVDLISSTKNVKVLFLIDTSGSNESKNNSEGTDPGKTWRLATLNSFIKTYGSKANFQFGFATFQGTSATPLLMSSSGHGIFTNDATQVQSAITAFQNIKDSGNTPYDAALAIVRDMIDYDQKGGVAKDAGYVVVMISDGTPTNNSYTDSKNGMTNLTNDVNLILAEAPGQISLNTVYLYNADSPTASQKVYLQKISSLGSGTFLEASSKDTLQISDTVQVPSTVCK